MPRRYLFGPVPSRFSEQYLRGPRAAGVCLTFDSAPGADLHVGPRDAWEDVLSRLPVGWRPDFVVLQPSYATVPACLWAAPVPLVGVAADWDLQWHSYRRRLRRCDLILADAAGAEVFRKEGLTQSQAANLSALALDDLKRLYTGAPKDIDVLFVGNCNPAVQRERLPWLARLARLGRRWRVALRTGVPEAEYRDLLTRARVVFNRSRNDACNRRAFEAAAAGALLFQEAGNQEVSGYFRDRRECVYYRTEDLESLLEYYLEHEEQRQALAQAARSRVPEFAFEKLWEAALRLIEGRWPELVERAGRRPSPCEEEDLLDRCQEALASSRLESPALLDDLRAASDKYPRSAALHNALGLLVARTARERIPTPPTAARAAEHFQNAAFRDSGGPVAQLNLIEALTAAGEKEPALEQARRALTLLGREPAGDLGWLQGAHFPPGFDTFRVEWERAAWANAGDPAAEAEAKRVLIRWRLQLLLAQQSGSVVHAYEAVLARPDLPSGRAALGHTLLRTGQAAEAATHLRRAVAANPFDRIAARSLAQALAAAGDAEGREALIRDRRLLARAAPGITPAEYWFAEDGPVGPSAAPAADSDELSSLPRRVSLTMIVKNEETNLPRCLASVADLVDDIVVVDTGSTDRTKEAAARFGARVFDFPWCDSFAAARNESLRHAAGDWVLWLDADDSFDEENRRRLRGVFSALGGEADAYAMKVRSALNAPGSAARVLDQVRLFPRRPGVSWRYRVHEQILPAVRRQGGEVRWTDVVIQHSGYQDAAVRRGKLERNLRLMRMDYDEHPEDAFTLFNLGWTTLDLGGAAEALPLLQRSLERSAPDSSIVRKLHVLIVQAHRQLGRRDEALAAAVRGRARYSDDAELLFEEAQLRRDKGELAETEECLRRLLQARRGGYFASVDAGLRGYRAYQLLAEVCQARGRVAEAESHWQAALAERPDFIPAWRGLGELYLAAGRWGEFEQAAQAMEQGSLSVEAMLFRARGHMARRDFAAARRLLEEVIASEPKALRPRVLLSRGLLQEHKDLAAAEKALRDVLALAPGHAEAGHNLSVLLGRKGPPPA